MTAAGPWIRIPPHDPHATYQIAGLIALETAVAITTRVLVITYPGVNRVPRPDDPAEIRIFRTRQPTACTEECHAGDARARTPA